MIDIDGSIGEGGGGSYFSTSGPPYSWVTTAFIIKPPSPITGYADEVKVDPSGDVPLGTICTWIHIRPARLAAAARTRPFRPALRAAKRASLSSAILPRAARRFPA